MMDLNHESSDNNPFDEPVSMKVFGKEMQAVFENFRKCTEEKINNSGVMTEVIKIVKEQHKNFRELVEDSIEFSNHFGDYSLDILFFAECFKNNNYSNEEISSLLKELLEKSQENHKLAKELCNRIKVNGPGDAGINDKLFTINELVHKYKTAIEECADKIDSDKKSKIEKGLRKAKHLKTAANCVLIGSAILLGGAGLLALVAEEVAVLLAAEEVAVLLAAEDVAVLAVSSLQFAVCGGSMYCEKKKEVDNLKVQLNLERDELVEKLNPFLGSLGSIISQIGRIETFWDEHVHRIKSLIKELERFDINERIKQKMIASKIEIKWKDVNEDCKIYRKVMKVLTIKDRLLD